MASNLDAAEEARPVVAMLENTRVWVRKRPSQPFYVEAILPIRASVMSHPCLGHTDHVDTLKRSYGRLEQNASE